MGDFTQLDVALKSTRLSRNMLPEKGVFGFRHKFDLGDFNAKRRQLLDAYLAKLAAQVQSIQEVPQLEKFLAPDRKKGLEQLQKEFPSWDRQALSDLVAATNGNWLEARKTLMAWSIDAGGDEEPCSAPDPVSPWTEAISFGIQPNVSSLGFRPGDSICRDSKARPVPLKRPIYDQIMVSRLSRNCSGDGIFTVLKAAAHWKTLWQRKSKHLDAVDEAASAVLLSESEKSALRFRVVNLLQGAAQSGTLRTALEEVAQEQESLQETVATPSKPSRTSSPQGKTREDELAAGRDLLRQRCRFLGLMDLEMEDDGNCQFRAMAQELYASQEHHDIVRSAVVEYLLQQKDKFAAFFEEGEWKEYIRKMAAPRTWGDELILRAASEAFQVRIHVISSTEQNWYIVYEPEIGLADDARNLFLTYVSPIHYNTVAPLR